MKVINQHINKYIDAFIENPTDSFESVFSEINNDEKVRLKNLLIYIFCIYFFDI